MKDQGSRPADEQPGAAPAGSGAEAPKPVFEGLPAPRRYWAAGVVMLGMTLAVLDGMVVTAADQTLVAPLTTVIETLQPKPEDIRALGPTGAVLVVRNTHVPIVDVGVALGYRTAAVDPSEGVALLVEAAGGGRAALLVDAIQGQRQVVIKSLEANFQQVEGIAAATILGDGRVALILDVDAVIASRRRGSGAAAASAPILKAAS